MGVGYVFQLPRRKTRGDAAMREVLGEAVAIVTDDCLRQTPTVDVQLLAVDASCIVPMNKICVTPRASLGFHQAYYDKAFTFGIKVTSLEGTSDLMSYYPSTVKDWIRRNGGLTTEMKKIKNGPDLWKIVDPCPEDF